MVEAGGLRFHVEEAGQGSPVLLLHGFPDTSRLWRHQVPALAAAGFRTIGPDLRGRGRSDRPEAVADYAMRLIVGDVIGIMDALGVARAHVVGHDWGAGAAWLLASLAPDRVDRLVAISVGFPAAAGRPDLETLQKAWYRILFQFGAAEDLLRQDDWYLARVLLGSNADLDRCLEDLSEPGALTAALNWYRANLPLERLLGPRSGASLPRVQAPTMGIWSTGDVYLTEGAMTRSAGWVDGGWRYERVEGASHWIPLDRPDLLNSMLLDFLSG